MAKRGAFRGWKIFLCMRRLLSVCAWACALIAAVGADAHADVDTSTGLGDNSLTNSGRFSCIYFFPNTYKIFIKRNLFICRRMVKLFLYTLQM